jgi:hypothetical protein
VKTKQNKKHRNDTIVYYWKEQQNNEIIFHYDKISKTTIVDVSDDDKAQAIVGKMRFKSKDFSFYRDTGKGT